MLYTLLITLKDFFWGELRISFVSLLVFPESLIVSSSFRFRTQEAPTLISSLSGKGVVSVTAGEGHSAAISEGGALYTWGKGSYGRLGHGG